jgi:hypothetical protein
MRSGSPPPSASDNREEFREAFVAKVHELLELGYRRIEDKKVFELKEEPDISGELARHIEDYLDILDEDWKRYYSICDEKPENEPQVPLTKRRLGKRRRRKDLRFRWTGGGMRAVYFTFEAKKLAQSGSFRDLLEEDGLGRFLDGHYARDDWAAGVIGYVTLGRPEEHAKKTGDELAKSSAKYHITSDGGWKPAKWSSGPSISFETEHNRPSLQRRIRVSFTFLRFC